MATNLKALQKKALDALSKANAYESKGDTANATKWRDEYNKLKAQYQSAKSEQEGAAKSKKTLSALEKARQELADAQEKAKEGVPGAVAVVREKEAAVKRLEGEAGNLPAPQLTPPKTDTTIGPKAVTATTEGTQKPSTGKKTTTTKPTAGTKTTPKPTAVVTPTEPSQTTGEKTTSAIAKAMELYQMPDIIFNNVPELRAILDKFLDPKKPITLDQFVKEVGNSTWYRQNSKAIQNRYLQKFNYDELVKSGKAVGTTQYEQDIKRITNNVIAKARELGALQYADPTPAQLIAEDLYIHNLDNDTAALTKRLAGAIRMAPIGTTGQKGYLGSAQADYQKLLTLAKNNGLSLQNILPTRVTGATNEELTNNVLAGLADGSLDISTIEQTARTLAAQGQPQYIKDLLAQGYDLASIYAPYKKTMATVLEINPDQIDLNDPTLRQAITPNGDMNIYDYTKMLRKDNRWQYTQQANEEVANATQKILQDFGFMG